MPDKTSFGEAQNAYETVRTTVDSLKVQYNQLCSQIADAQRALDNAPLLRVPLTDMKAAVLDFFSAAGDRYAADVIAPAISAFARNHNQGTGGDRELVGKPLRFCDLEDIIGGGSKDFANQLATPSKNIFDDRALYALFAPMIKARVQVLMGTMSPADFGYNKIDSSSIGSDRATRRLEIEALKGTLNELNERRIDLKTKLVALGVTPAALQNIGGIEL